MFCSMVCKSDHQWNRQRNCGLLNPWNRELEHGWTDLRDMHPMNTSLERNGEPKSKSQKDMCGILQFIWSVTISKAWMRMINPKFVERLTLVVSGGVISAREGLQRSTRGLQPYLLGLFIYFFKRAGVNMLKMLRFVKTLLWVWVYIIVVFYNFVFIIFIYFAYNTSFENNLYYILLL